jgi:multiple sugar transport system ATP-binding protein
VKSKSINLHGIRKQFGPHCVLEDLELNIDPGEFLVMLGPSGCGKSTLLNIVAGLEEASSGQVMIGDRDVTRLEPSERDIAMVFQSFALYPTMSVRQNIGFALKTSGMPSRDVAIRVNEIARLLQIEHLLDRRPGQLSGGQQQRVAIGRALVRSPAALLLDEPLSNLDAKLRTELRGELKRLHEESARTTLFVTHDQLEAMTLATRIAVLGDGRIQQCDRPTVVYHQPANLFVASFIGAPTMTFIEGQLRCVRDILTLATATGEEVPLPGLTCPRRLANGDYVVLGFRPEHVELVGHHTEASVPGHVTSTESTGPDIYACIAAAGQQVTARVASHTSLQRRQEISIRIDGRAVGLFHPQNGARLN